MGTIFERALGAEVLWESDLLYNYHLDFKTHHTPISAIDRYLRLLLLLLCLRKAVSSNFGSTHIDPYRPRSMAIGIGIASLFVIKVNSACDL